MSNQVKIDGHSTPEQIELHIDQMPPESAKEMHLFDHLSELRKRLIYAAIGVIIGSVIGYLLSSHIFTLLSAPYYAAFPKDTLIGTGPAEAFLIRLKVSFFAGVVISSPVLFAQLWLFIAPGLYPSEKKLVVPFLMASSLLFLLGLWACYSIMLPVAFAFFRSQYDAVGLAPQIRISEHISLMISALLGFGAVCEMPVLAFLLGRVGLITHRTLIDWGRAAIVICFVVSAIITPPDVLSQLLMAGLLLMLYGASIILLKFTAKQSNQ